jgi:hypothetical protein
MFLLVFGFYSESDSVKIVIDSLIISNKRDGKHWQVETTSTCSSSLTQENAVQKLETLETHSDVV